MDFRLAVVGTTAAGLRFGADQKLYVGTGDAAIGTNPQDLDSLGGKVLRMNPDGTVPLDNPFVGGRGNARYVLSYGHRNIQGVALRPRTDQLWGGEHGTDRDDEINLIARGANYGFDPVPGYNEAVPMTDRTKYPAARPAVWRSGQPTISTSGVTFLTGARWGRWEGAMAVGVLKGRGIKIMMVNPGGGLASQEWLPIAGREDRIREVIQGPDGDLYYTTSNNNGDDRIVRLAATPARTLLAYRRGLDVPPVGVSAARSGSTLGDHSRRRRQDLLQAQRRRRA